MLANRKRSLSDVRHVYPPRRSLDNELYRTTGLHTNQQDGQADRVLLQRAKTFGISPTQASDHSVDYLADDVSSIRIGSASSIVPEQGLRAESIVDFRKSQSLHAPSDSSTDSRGHRKTPSLAATSITSVPSSTSASSNKSSYVKFKRGFKRFSTIRSKRKTLQSQPSAPELLARPPATGSGRPVLPNRSHTVDRIIPVSQPQSPAVVSPPLSPTGRPTGRRKVTSMTISAPLQPQSTLLSPTNHPTSPYSVSGAPSIRSPPPMPTPGQADPPLRGRSPSPAALERSRECPRLRKIRTAQLQEQLRFISFRASQIRQMRTRHLQLKRDRLAAYKSQKALTESKHAQTLSDLEHRHLSAEEDLNGTLDTERQACDTRLKHMQAYCSPQENIEKGMPHRDVTKEDFKKLENQYHVRSQINNLHASRINVLRERQGKQFERIMDKQEKELEKLAADFGRENEALDAKFEEQEKDMEMEFKERKDRLNDRWITTEAVERRNLEHETGQSYGPLPGIGWADEHLDGEEVEALMRRLFAEKNITFDPDQGFTAMEKSDFDIEDVIAGAQNFDIDNVI